MADLFMLFRETIFFVIGIPAIYLTLRSILFLRRGAIASSRIFLRREMMIKASRFLLLSSIIGFLEQAKPMYGALPDSTSSGYLEGCSS